MNVRGLIVVLLSAVGAGIVGSADADDRVDYLKQIKPLLKEKCYSCHGVLKQEAGMRLETRSLMLAGGDSGAIVVPGKPDESLIVERISGDEFDRMPPDGAGAKLKPGEIALVRKWIEQGAVAPDEETPLGPRDHWAFQRIERPEIPDAGSSIHPVDRFLAAKRVERNLRTVPPAERSIQIRRLYLDLIGLPPTREQLHDDRPWSEIVDELLASPQYGERWARHWMDVWRYSDWYGLGAQLRYSQKHLWHWRDWIVESLNADKGYDRMIQEMLAGDELAPEDPDVLRATGFLARNYYLFNRTTWLDNTIEHTSKAFLGLTLNCTKCHDHKYDPFTQLDYYRFRAIFEPHQVRLDEVPGVTDFNADGLPRVFDDHPEIPTYLHVRGDPKNPDESKVIAPGVPELFAGFAPEIEPVELPPYAYAPGTRDYVQRDRLKALESKIEVARNELTAAREKLAALAKREAEKPTGDVTAAAFKVQDNFDAPNPELWELIGEGWEYRDGALHQTESTREPYQVRLRKTPPRDFVLTCRYTHTGGTTYRSVTFRFDQSDDQKYSNFVYSSAHGPGPKIQIAYTRNGQSTYPAAGRVARPVKIGEPYTLKFAVRDLLVNVWWNDEFLLAYRLPDRKPGAISLSGFDSTVAFDSIVIESLPDDLKLTEAKGDPPATSAGAEAAVRVAEAKLKASQADLAALEAVIAADNARFRGEANDEAAADLAKIAAIRQAESRKAAAELEVATHQNGDAKKLKAAQTQLTEAIKKLKAAEKGEGEYAPLRGSFKGLETPAHKEPDYPATYSRTSTGRRLALAKWITSRENPLPARVAVNHVWLRHFGKPLVESVDDFGLRSARPDHAELLDYLAAEFIDSGWSFKHLHRVIVTSEAYRLSSSTAGADAATLAADPTNRWYWRMNARRMESQVVRDSLLALAGTLDTAMGGPSLNPGNNVMRRSLYFKHSRDQQDKFLSMFDDADHLQCYRRTESIVPQQALALSNSKISIEMADKIAGRIAKSLPDADRSTFVAAAFETILGRLPDDTERDACLTFSNDLAKLLSEKKMKDAEPRIRARLVQSLLNHNDFVSIR